MSIMIRIKDLLNPNFFHLKDTLEELIKKGKLRRFAKNGNSREDRKKYKC
jgi:hypothetical protein